MIKYFLILSMAFIATSCLVQITQAAENASIGSTVEINSDTTNGPILSSSDHYGFSVASIGDLNNDGVEDIAVGARYDDAGGTSRGTVHIHFMNTDGSVDSTSRN